MKSNLELALIKLGYRQLNENKWAKPIGYHLFGVDTKEMTIHNYFKSFEDGSIIVYDSKKITSNNKSSDFYFANQIAEFEAYSNLACGQKESFGFLSNRNKEELYEKEM